MQGLFLKTNILRRDTNNISVPKIFTRAPLLPLCVRRIFDDITDHGELEAILELERRTNPHPSD